MDRLTHAATLSTILLATSALTLTTARKATAQEPARTDPAASPPSDVPAGDSPSAEAPAAPPADPTPAPSAPPPPPGPPPSAPPPSPAPVRVEAAPPPPASAPPASAPPASAPPASAPPASTPPPSPTPPPAGAAADGGSGQCANPPCDLEPPKEKDDDDDSGGIFGPFRVGPIVGLGFPNFFNYGVTAKLAKVIGLGINAGHIFDTKMPLMGEASVNYNEIDLYGRLYPFAGGFFVGAGVGYETANATFTKDAQSLSGGQTAGGTNPTITSTGSVRALILTPQIGWLWNFDFGLAFGIDVGAQIPIAPSETTASTDVPSSIPEPTRTDIQTAANSALTDTLKSVGKAPLPMANVRIGWLF